MMLGNVAPAPLSFTCARAGAASARAAATASRGVLFIPYASSGLERELSLEQRLRAGREIQGVQHVRLVIRVVPVAQQSPVGRQLIRHAADEPRLLVDRAALLVRDVYPAEDRHLGLGHL